MSPVLTSAQSNKGRSHRNFENQVMQEVAPLETNPPADIIPQNVQRPHAPEDPTPGNPHPHRKGKIARLPKELREDLNSMLADNRPYLEIIARFKQHLPDLSEENLSRWRKGG